MMDRVVDGGPGGGSGNSGDYTTDIAETLRFQEEIQSLMRESILDSGPDPASNHSSFTALLGMPPNQAMELLHHEPIPPVAVEIYRSTQGDFPFRCSPTFPSNAGLVERAARYSVFAAEGSSPSNSGNNSSSKVKSEPADSDSNPVSSQQQQQQQQKRVGAGKRKESEKNKGKSSGKKNKNGGGGDAGDENKSGGEEKLPYVHVRARRGQATDSHSLAERARREKINARMKLLQELVPGCSKISGTALVLDEIINHVQSLQRQVEFLSMRLAAVNPRIDFGGLDSFLAAENGRVTGANGAGGVGLEQTMWPEVHVDGVRRRQQQIWQVDLLPSHQSSSLQWDREDNHHQNQQPHHGFISPGPSLFGFDSVNPVSMHANQLKTEL